uniref:SCP domain-containing protein n=1 Tax=Mesocestoides corti TaxID=53468 RepID=A0A5K3FDJ0_MESCO
MIHHVISIVALASCAAAKVPSDQQRVAIVEAHTTIRELVNPPASNMKLMNYSLELEQLAETWVKNCTERKPDPDVKIQYRNVAFMTFVRIGNDLPFEKKVSTFGDSVIFYDYDHDSCLGDCSFYKQTVWANTTDVGCANNRCDSLVPNATHPVYLMACLYTPAGNVPNMQPYENGKYCSKCPAGYKYCHRKQCSKNSVSSFVLSTGILILSMFAPHSLA